MLRNSLRSSQRRFETFWSALILSNIGTRAAQGPGRDLLLTFGASSFVPASIPSRTRIWLLTVGSGVRAEHRPRRASGRSDERPSAIVGPALTTGARAAIVIVVSLAVGVTDAL